MFAYTKLMQAMAAAGVVSATDPYFNLTTLLLPGNGTNGAQNNTFLDSSTNNFTITRNGNTTQGTFSPFSQTGWSINNTTNEHGIKTSSSVAIGTSVFTMEFWIYFTNTPSTGTIGFCADGTNNSGIFYGDLTSLGFGQANVGLNLSGTPGFTLNAWFHVAVARDSSNRMSIWVNGSRIATATGITANYATAPMAMGGSGFRYQGYCSNGRLVVGTAVYDPTATTITVPTSPLTAITNTSVLLGTSNRFNDASANNYGITVTGTPSVQAFSPFAPTAAYSAATNGGSGYFDGTGDYLSAATNSAFSLASSAFTIEAWVYFLDVSVQKTIITTYGGASTGWTLQLIGGVITFNASGDGADITGTVAIKANQWYHIAVSGTAGTSTKLFINGVQDGSTYTGNIVDSSSSLLVGQIDSTSYLNGYLSGVRVIKGTALYTTTFTPPTAPLTAVTNTSLLLNFTNAGITDATAKNVLETVGNAQISTTQSKFGGSSMYFDGTGDYLSIPYSSIYTIYDGDFTVEGWIYPATVTGSELPVFKLYGPTNAVIELRQVNNTMSMTYRGTNGTSSTLTSSAGTIAINTWQHVAFVRSSGTLRAFIDGTQYTTATNTSSQTETGLTIRVGSNQTGTATFNGYIDDFRFSRFARYTASFTPPTAAFPLQ